MNLLKGKINVANLIGISLYSYEHDDKLYIRKSLNFMHQGSIVVLYFNVCMIVRCVLDLEMEYNRGFRYDSIAS